MEGPENLSSPWTQSSGPVQLALWSVILEVAHSCCPAWRDAEGSTMHVSASGSHEPLKARLEGAHFLGYLHSLQGLCPHQGSVSMHSHEHPLALTWCSSSHIKGDALTSGLILQKISTLNVYLTMESRGRGKGWLLSYQCKSWCCHRISPASLPCLLHRQRELK